LVRGPRASPDDAIAALRIPKARAEPSAGSKEANTATASDSKPAAQSQQHPESTPRVARDVAQGSASNGDAPVPTNAPTPLAHFSDDEDDIDYAGIDLDHIMEDAGGNQPGAGQGTAANEKAEDGGAVAGDGAMDADTGSSANESTPSDGQPDAGTSAPIGLTEEHGSSDEPMKAPDADLASDAHSPGSPADEPLPATQPYTHPGQELDRDAPCHRAESKAPPSTKATPSQASTNATQSSRASSNGNNPKASTAAAGHASSNGSASDRFGGLPVADAGGSASGIALAKRASAVPEILKGSGTAPVIRKKTAVR
jgi:hypothetical protein